MAIGRISGQMLYSNLDRSGSGSLTIDGNLTHFDTTNRRVGINTTTPDYDLDVPGNVRLANLTILGDSITSNTGELRLGSISNVKITGGLDTYIIYTDGQGNLDFADLSTFGDFGSLAANIEAANAAIVTANNAVVGYVNTLNSAMLANVNAANLAIITANNSVVSYVNTLNSLMVANITATNTAIVTANIALKAYVDDQDSVLRANITAANAAIVTANTSVVSYVNTLNSAMLANVDAANAAIVTANTAVVDYVDDRFSITSYSNIYQNNSSVSVYDTGVGNVVVNVDGNNIAYFGSNSFTVSSLTLANSSIISNSVINFYANGAVGIPTGNSSNRPIGDTGYLRYNTDITTLEYYDGSIWRPISNTVTDQSFTGDGTSLVYSLDQDSTNAGTLVSINGTLQQPGVSYNISGTQITFAEALLNSDVVDVRFLGGVVSHSSVLFDDLTVSGKVTASNVQVSTGGFMQMPVYTKINLTAITGQIGWTAAVSDSIPGGQLAFWDTTNTRWSYVSDNSAV